MDKDKTKTEYKDYNEWKTRVYENDDLRAARKHTWIGTDEEAAEIEARKTRIMQGLPAYPDDKTRIYPDMMGGNTGRINKLEIEPPLREQKKSPETDDARESVSLAERMRRLKQSVKSIRISDSRRFKRFIAVCVFFAVLLAVELSYFYVSSAVNKMPDNVNSINKQIEELEAENEELKAETDLAGDFDSKKELKESWERLRDKLKEQVEETSSL